MQGYPHHIIIIAKKVVKFNTNKIILNNGEDTENTLFALNMANYAAASDAAKDCIDTNYQCLYNFNSKVVNYALSYAPYDS